MQDLSNQQLKQLRNDSIAAHRAGRLDVALAGYARVLASFPKDAGLWTNLGALFRSQSRHEDALRAQWRAYALDPEAPGIRNNLANILNDLGHHQDSIEHRKRALDIDPDDSQQKALTGRALRSLGRYDDSIDVLSRALHDHPEDAEIELQLAFSNLAAGAFATGFKHYEARWRTKDSTPPKELPFPKWKGEDLHNQKVLIVPEQGFGDAVMMLRFLPQLKHVAGTVHVLSEKPMTRLFQGIAGADWVGSNVAATTDFDCWLTVMDLPGLFMQTTADIPVPTSLNIPDDSVARAKSITAAHQGTFKVGIVWSGSTTFKGNSFRSFGHRRFLPLSEIEGVQCFSLYKGPALGAFQNDGSQAFIVDAASTDRDFADCAAMMQEMDLIITSDTATAHIAGSLGRPTWCLLHWDPFWFFGHSGDTMPWYPTMRLFRQAKPQDWDSVFDVVTPALTDLAQSQQQDQQ